MTDIRRHPLSNTPVFVTAVCHQRRQILRDEIEKQRLLVVMHEVKNDIFYRMLAYAILDDHFHGLIQPKNSHELSRIMQSIKLRFTHRHKQAHGITDKVALWQRRFWDHQIRHEEDMRRHMDYIHYNPVKHGYVATPAHYRWSSMPAWIKRGIYTEHWAANEGPCDLGAMQLE